MPDYIVIPFGPRENRPHKTRSPGTRARRNGSHQPADSRRRLEQPLWDSTYVDPVHTADNQQVAGITLNKLDRYYKDHQLVSTLPNRLATLAIHEAKGLLDRGICYGDQETDPTVTQLWPSVEGLVITALYSRRKLNWLMHRLPQGSNEDFDQLQALPEWLTLHAPPAG